MDRTKLVQRIIICIKQLKEEADELFKPDNIISHSDLMIEEYFLQKFNPYLDKVKHDIKELPPDEYLAIELDVWIKMLDSKLKIIKSDSYFEKYAEVLYIKQTFYPKLMDFLRELKLEVLENEFDARTDVSVNLRSSKIEFGPNTLVVSPSVVAALVSLLYNFNVLSPNQDMEQLHRVIAQITGFNREQIAGLLEMDINSGRLKAKVSTDDLKFLSKLLRSMAARTEFIISYND